MNKNLIYFLTAIRNASIAKKNVIKVKKLKNFDIYMNVLYKEGFIQSFFLDKEINSNTYYLTIKLRRYENRVITSDIKSISTPTKVKILSYNEITQLRLKNKRMILSTSKGVISDAECLKRRLGGTAIFIC